MSQLLMMYLAPLPVFALVILCAGIALMPAVALGGLLWDVSAGLGTPGSWLVKGCALAGGFYLYGLALLFVAPLFKRLLVGRLKPYRGPALSWKALPWYLEATFTLLPRYSFLDFVTPTAYTLLFYRLMGMKIGRNVYINSTAIADPSMIELEDGVTIGGSASVIAHRSQGGRLVLEPVRIRQGATIGMRAIIMGGTEIGPHATVMANSFVLPRTRIPAGEVWGGIPAHRLDLAHEAEP